MSARVDETETAMYSTIDDVTTIQAGLILEIFLILGVNVLDYGLVTEYTDTQT